MKAAALLLLLAAPLRADDLFAPVLAEAEAQGLRVLEKVSGRSGKTPLLAAIYRDGDSTALRAYAGIDGKPFLVYLHPNAGETQSFERSWKGRPLADLWGGRPFLLYRSRNPALGQSMLHVLRFQSPRFRRAGSFLEGELRDLDGDGSPEIVARRRPLGRWLSVECAGFATTADGVFSEEVQAWDGERFVDATARFPEHFAERVESVERELAALRPKAEERAGDYAAKAISLYFLYAARGESRRGWERFAALVEPARAIPGSGACVSQIKADLRRRLSIPPDWP